MTRTPATAARRLVTVLGLVTGLLVSLAVLVTPALDGGPQALLGGALVAAVVSGTALVATAAGVAVVLLVGVPAQAPVVRWDQAVAVVLDDQPGRPGRARPRAPGARTSPRRLAR